MSKFSERETGFRGQRKQWHRRARQFATQLATDNQGVAAIEFALLLPLLATTLLATADLVSLASRSFQVQSLAQSAAAAIAHLSIVPAAPDLGSPLSNALPGGVSPYATIAPSAKSLPQALPPQSGRSSAENAAVLAEIAPAVLEPSPSLIEGLGLPQVSVAALVELPAGADASSLLFWGCSEGENLHAVRTPICPDGARAAAYVEVLVRAPVRRFVDWPDQLLSHAVEARAVVRLG